MKSIFFFLANVFFIGAIYGVPTKLSGIITNTQSQQIELTYYDNLVNFKQVVLPVRLDVIGEFTANLDIDEPLICKLHVGSKSLHLFLEPGDDIYLSMDILYGSNDVTFIGQGAVHNNYLQSFNNKFGKEIISEVRRKISSLDAEPFKKYVDRIALDKKNFYSEFKTYYSLSPEFDAYARAEIDYWRAYNLLQYRWEHPSKGKEPPLFLAPEYYTFLDEMIIDNPQALISMNYTYFIDDFLAYQEELRKRSKITNESPYRSASIFFSGKTYAYIQATELYKKLKYAPSPETLTDTKTYISNSPYTQYTRTLSEAYQSAESLSPGKMAPDFELVDINGNYVRLSDYKGKIVLLGFWATWCNPCLHEMYYSKRLYNEFNKSEVEFVYVALERSKESWSSYVIAEELSGVQLFAEGNYETLVAIDYGIQSIPYYILIDKDGVIQRNPERRPSQGGIKEDIRSLLSGQQLK